MTTRSWRGVAAVAGLLGLLALVAFAAAGHAPGGGSSRPSASTPSLLKDYLATIALLMIPAGAFLIFYAAFLKRAYKDVPLMKSRVYPFHIAPKPFAYLTVVRHPPRSRPVLGPPEQQRRPAVAVLPAGSHRRQRPQRATRTTRTSSGCRCSCSAPLIVGIVGSMMLLTYRRRREEDDPEVMRVTVAQVLSETLDDLVREPDPRKAVIGAYARMERTLAARGFPREESEAPDEYLARILAVVGASGHSVRRLTRLFERARFSEHEIDSGMKEDAIDSLSGLRAELLVAT